MTERALLQRLNRVLAKQGRKLLHYRGSDVGRWRNGYCAIDLDRNFVWANDVDLEELGRELGVLKPWEHVAED